MVQVGLEDVGRRLILDLFLWPTVFPLDSGISLHQVLRPAKGMSAFLSRKTKGWMGNGMGKYGSEKGWNVQAG